MCAMEADGMLEPGTGRRNPRSDEVPPPPCAVCARLGLGRGLSRVRGSGARISAMKVPRVVIGVCVAVYLAIVVGFMVQNGGHLTHDQVQGWFR